MLLGAFCLVLAGLPAAALASPAAASLASAPTSYTGIDPGVGEFYTYAPSVIQLNASTRYVFYCGNSVSNEVHDHVYASLAHFANGQWHYGAPKDVFGPQNDPDPQGFFAYHACEPEVIGGNFHFGGQPYKWALFFTAESTANNSTNQIGVAFAKSLPGPWKPDLTPIIQTSDDFGQNSYPNDCPPNLYCLGQPAATSMGGNGKVLLTYMSNAGSPGTATAPTEGLVLRQLDLSNVPASGPCRRCMASIPGGKGPVEAVTQAGLSWSSNDATIAYDSAKKMFVIGYDAGPNNPPNPQHLEVPVTPYVDVATISKQGFLSGTGTWHFLGAVGACQSGHALNHNAGLVRSSNGRLVGSKAFTMLYTVANHDLNGVWDLYGYRMWTIGSSFNGKGLLPVASAPTPCSGYEMATSTGQVTGAGSATRFPVTPASPTVGFTLTADKGGYYLLGQNGQVTAHGDAHSQPSPSPKPSGTTPVGLALDPATGGYWVAYANGAVAGSNAPVLGSLQNSPHGGGIIAIAQAPDGIGYYLLTSTGAVFGFGHAPTFGAPVALPAGVSATAMTATPDGLGYYVLSSSGAVIPYGDAQVFPPGRLFAGSPATSIATTTDGLGYWVATSGGTVAPFGDAQTEGPASSPAGVRGVIALNAT
jgi:hypothetical protein